MHDSNDDTGGQKNPPPRPPRDSGVANTVLRTRTGEMRAAAPSSGEESTLPRGSDGSGKKATPLIAAGSEELGTEPTSKSADPLVGKTVGEYIIRKKLGAGGMGLVYEAEQPMIGRRVAIKMLRPELTSNAEQMRTLLDEARATNAIRHRGIIDIFGFGTLQGYGQYMVMEYLDGEPLDSLITRRAPMLAADAIPILDETLAALSAAHAVGVIHRDLKPSNIFMSKESSGGSYVKVLDFGLAKQAQAPHAMVKQTRASVMVGTPEYMAPEQACGQTVGPMSDLYAVGVIAFEMLTGRLPFEGENPVQIAIQQVNNAPPSPSQFAQMPEELDRLILDLLEKDTGKRPGSAEIVRQRLRRIGQQLANDRTQVKVDLRKMNPQPQPQKPDTITQPNPKKARETPSVLLSPSLETPPVQSGERTLPQSRDTEREKAVKKKPPMALIAGGVGAVVLVAIVGAVLATRGSSKETVAPLPEQVKKEPVRLPDPIDSPKKHEDPPKKAVEEQKLAVVDPPKKEEPVEQVEPPKKDLVVKASDVAEKKPLKAVAMVTPEKKVVKKAEPAKMGKVSVRVDRWADVYIDGKQKGRMPTDFHGNVIDLTAGSHDIEFRNDVSFVRYKAKVVVPADGTTSVQVKWEPNKP